MKKKKKIIIITAVVAGLIFFVLFFLTNRSTIISMACFKYTSVCKIFWADEESWHHRGDAACLKQCEKEDGKKTIDTPFDLQNSCLNRCMHF